MKASSSVARRARPPDGAGLSLVSTRPACISEMRSQRSASFMKWVEMKMVTLSRRTAPPSAAQKLSRNQGRRQKSGSSRINQLGLVHHATASDGAGACRTAGARRAASNLRPRPAGQSAPAWFYRAGAPRPLARGTGGRAAPGFAAPSTRCRARRPATYSPPGAVAPCRGSPLAEQPGLPSLAGSRPVSIFMVVDLPQPLEPRKPKISPRWMRKETWSTATKSPNAWSGRPRWRSRRCVILQRRDDHRR